MSIDGLEAEMYQLIMDKELKDLEPYLEKIELILPDRPITPLSQFRLIVKASGSDLPCNGSWFQIAVAEQGLPNATIIAQPQGETISFGMTGEWHVELQAPIEEGDFWLHAIMGSVETEESVVEIPFTVKHNPNQKLDKPNRNRIFYTIVFLSFALGIFWLAFFFAMEPAYEVLNKYFRNVSAEPTMTAPIPEKVAEETKKQIVEDSKTKAFIDELLEQSFNNSKVTVRQKAWQQLSQFIDTQTDADNPYVREILQQRSLHKKQMESWLTSNEKPLELFKRIQVLASADDDKNAQLWLGNYYASGKIVVKHLGKAWQWYQRAAYNGNTESQHLLDELEDRADQLLNSPKLKEREQGYDVTEEVAFAGGVNAQLWMGYRYEMGDGVTRNLEVAADWYRKASEHGNTLAREKLSRVLDLIAKQNI